MREIKFRAWNEVNKRWDKQMSAFSVFRESGTVEFELNGIARIIICQYTGLKDKNGKEIYEGDILDGHSDGLVKIEYNAPNYIATFDDENSIGLDELMLWFGNSQAWVIGNIYENPDLLV